MVSASLAEIARMITTINAVIVLFPITESGVSWFRASGCSFLASSRSERLAHAWIMRQCANNKPLSHMGRTGADGAADVARGVFKAPIQSLKTKSVIVRQHRLCGDWGWCPAGMSPLNAACTCLCNHGIVLWSNLPQVLFIKGFRVLMLAGFLALGGILLARIVQLYCPLGWKIKYNKG